MKKITILLISLAIVSINGTITAQQADNRVNELFSRGDWITLDAEFSRLRPNIQSEKLIHLSEAMIGYHFNEPEKALHAIDWLLENAEAELGSVWMDDLIEMRNSLLGVGKWQIFERISTILNQDDWFTFREKFPTPQDEKSELLRHISEAMIAFHFNQPEKAIRHLNWLIDNTPYEFGFELVHFWASIKSNILFTQGRYTESENSLVAFFTQFAPQECLEPLFKQFEHLRNEAKPQIIRPDRDIEIPLTIKDVEGGRLMYIPVKVNGKEYNFVFNSGGGITFLTEHLANEMGVRIVKDSITLCDGSRTEIGKLGILDSLMIGDIVFKNPLIAIELPNEETDTLFRPDAMIGVDFIRMMGEVRIFPHENRIVFPMQKTELPSFGSNLMLLDFALSYLKTYSNEERLVFEFSTRSRRTDLDHPYYTRHREKLGEIGERRLVSRWLDSFYAYQLPTLSLTVGDTDVVLTDIDVLLNEEVSLDPNKHGVLGMDFFTSFRKIIINFVDMFVKVEK